MKRRDFIKGVGAGSVLAGGTLAAPAVHAKTKHRWKMVTTWPKNFPGLGTGANNLAKLITEMSGGRIEVKVYGAKELVPAFEIFDAVSRGTAEMGHGASYYWKGKSEAAQFFTAVPFGLTAQEMNAWLYHGGGMELWQEVYAPFGLVPTAAVNTGVQMGGWFNKEINSLEDLKGLKMRIPGLGGEVLKRARRHPGEPPRWRDLHLPAVRRHRCHRVGRPLQRPGLRPLQGRQVLLLPRLARARHRAGVLHQQGGVRGAAGRSAGHRHQRLPGRQHRWLSEFTARNNQALDTLVNRHNVQLRRFPDSVLKELKGISDQVVAEVAAKDPMSKKVYDSFRAFRDQVVAWHDVSERAYLNARAL